MGTATKSNPLTEAKAIIAKHPEFTNPPGATKALMDKEIVALVEAGKADAKEAMAFMGARRYRRYATS